MADAHQQDDEVGAEEIILRRIHPNAFSRRKNRPDVSQFMPRQWKSADQPGDADGLSVSRAKITSLALAARCPHTGREFPVASLEHTFIRSIELSVRPDPVPSDAGHALIPEMNSLTRRESAERERWMEERAKKLRDHATIVHLPPE